MPKTILIAEDDQSDAALLEQTLRAAGVTNPLAIVNDGDQVLAYLNGEGRYSDRKAFPLPTVLFLDLKMPRMNGFRVLEWLSGKSQFTPMLIVVLTGAREYKEAQKGYQWGAHTFLTKPCTTEDIQNLKNTFAGFWESYLPLDRWSTSSQLHRT